MKLTDYFQQIYILNLPERQDRREATIAELKSIGITLAPGKVEFFPAIRPETAEPFHKKGSKGCFLSTLAILKKAKAQGEANVLILQDDIQFPHFFTLHEDDLLNRLSELNWDIAQFGYQPGSVDGIDQDPSLAEWKDTSSQIIGAHFVGFNGKSIDRFIQFLEGLLERPRDHPQGGPMPIDGAFTVFRRQNSDVVRVIALPSFGYQRSSRSDVTTKWFDRLPVLSRMAQSYRKLKHQLATVRRA